METLAVKQKLNFSLILKRAEEFVSSERMLPVLGAFVTLFHIGGFDMVGFTVLAAYMVFVFLSNANIRGGIPPLLFSTYVVSNQNGIAGPDKPLNGSFYLGNIWFFAALVAVVILSAAYGIFKRRLKFRLSFGFIGVAAMCVSFIAGGIGYEEYSVTSLAVGGVIALYFMLFFLFFSFAAPSLDFDYIAKTVIISTLVVLFQLFHVFLLTGAFSQNVAMRKSLAALGWGISNNIAPMIALGLPFSGYYMCAGKHPWYGFLVFAAQMIGIIFTFSRAMVLFAVPFAVAMLVYALIRSKGAARVQMLILSAIAAVAAVLILVFQWGRFVSLVDHYIETGFNDSGRMDIYRDAWEIFLKYPFFGAGAAYKIGTWDMYFHMAHNTFLQFMMWSGVVGLAAIIVHIIFTGMTMFYRPNEKRIFLMLGALLIFLHSMLDWMWFYPFALLYYMLFLTAAEKDCMDNGFGRIKLKG